MEAAAVNEPAESEPQVILLPEQDLRDWRRLRHELRGVRHQREQVVLHFELQHPLS